MAVNQQNFIWVCIALIVTQAGFGAFGVLICKFAKNNKTDPLVFCLLRDGGCIPILFLAAYAVEKKIYMLKKSELLLFAVLGFFGMFLSQLLYLLGVYHTTADIASMFQPIVSVWACLNSIIFKTEKMPRLSEKIGMLKIAAIVIASVGAIVMTYGKSLEHAVTQNADLFLGCLFLLGNTYFASLFIILQKKYIFANPLSRWRECPIGVTAWMYMFGFISMAFACLYYVNKPEKFLTITHQTLFPLIYAIFITSSLCYILIAWCNMQMSPTFVSASWPLQVLFCITLAYFVLGEVLSIIEVFGGCLIIAAMLAIVWANYMNEVKSN